MPAGREGKYYNSGSEVPDVLHDNTAGLIRVLKVGIRQSGVPPLGHAEEPSCLFGLLGAQVGAPPGPRLSRRQVQNAS
jgi:hypothetical protein